MACPPVSLPSTSSTQLGRAVLGSNLFLLNFFWIDFLDFVENQPVCHIYQWVAHPTRGGVCNHCERMMDGLTMDDVIAGNREGSLTEDDVVQFVQNGDPNDRDWDEWPLRMTFRINSFLRAQGPVGEPDLAALGFLDDYFFNFFTGTHCLLRHHTQWIRPLQSGFFRTSIPILIRLSTSL